MKALKIIIFLLLVSAYAYSQEEDPEFNRLKKLESLEKDSINPLDKEKDTLSFRFGSKRYAISRNLTSWSSGSRSINIGTGISSWNKFRGHYAGISLGINNYFTNSSDFELVDENHFMALRPEKSIEFRLNLFQVSRKITNHFGVISGLGLTANNYRFKNGNSIRKLDGKIALDPRYTQSEYDTEKTKLVLTYLDIPLLLEVNGKIWNDTWFVNTGVVGSLLIGSHTKNVYSIKPPLGDGNRQKYKNRSDFYVNRVKASVLTQLGWNDLSVYFKYDLIHLFEDGKGPELIPFSTGVQLCF